MMSIADELVLLADTKEDLRVSLGLSKDVPFSQYAAYTPWYNDDIPIAVTAFDFKKNRYAKDGKAVYLDDASEFIRLSSATEWHDGNLVEVQDSIPRISGEGLLIEDQRTNFCLNSQNASSRVKNGVTLIPFNYIGLQGDAARFTANPTNNQYTNFGFMTYTAGQSYAATVYVKMLNGQAPVFVTTSTTNAQNQFSILFAGGGTSYATIPTVELIDGANNIYKVIATKVTARDDAEANQIYRYTSNSMVEYEFEILAMQVERGSFPTSYISTSGTPVSRSPDILNIPLLPTQTITGDWDADVTYSVDDNIATFTGHGYIRNITVEAI